MRLSVFCSVALAPSLKVVEKKRIFRCLLPCVFPSWPLPVLLYQVSILKQQAAHRWEEEKKSPAQYKYYWEFLGSISLMWMELLSWIVASTLSAPPPPPPPPPLLSLFLCFLSFPLHLRTSLNLSGILLSYAIIRRGCGSLWEPWASCDLICSQEMWRCSDLFLVWFV